MRPETPQIILNDRRLRDPTRDDILRGRLGFYELLSGLGAFSAIRLCIHFYRVLLVILFIFLCVCIYRMICVDLFSNTQKNYSYRTFPKVFMGVGVIVRFISMSTYMYFNCTYLYLENYRSISFKIFIYCII